MQKMRNEGPVEVPHCQSRTTWDKRMIQNRSASNIPLFLRWHAGYERSNGFSTEPRFLGSQVHQWNKIALEAPLQPCSTYESSAYLLIKDREV